METVLSYLQQRQIATTVDGVLSDPLPITSGVPQGSVLGSLLFVLYFRELPATVSSECALFADDTLIYDTTCKGTDSLPCCSLQQDVDRVSSWADSWSTTFNASKSAHMIIHRRSLDGSSAELTLREGVIPLQDSVRHLGVVLSSSLTWSAHIHRLLQGVSCKVFVLKRLAHRVWSTHLVKRLYLGLLRPVLKYGGAVWDGCSRADEIVLERVQLSVGRAVLRAGHRSAIEATEILAALFKRVAIPF